jgi:hypothetical protein
VLSCNGSAACCTNRQPVPAAQHECLHKLHTMWCLAVALCYLHSLHAGTYMHACCVCHNNYQLLLLIPSALLWVKSTLPVQLSIHAVQLNIPCTWMHAALRLYRTLCMPCNTNYKLHALYFPENVHANRMHSHKRSLPN